MAQRVADGELSARETVEAHIRKIESVNPKLNAVVVPLFERALADAAAADAKYSRREQLGPLHGVPMTIKEVIDVADTPATAGVPGEASRRSATDSPLVERLRRAGAIILGKTNVAQLLIYVEADNPVYGRANNPWRLDRTPGGSSGGEGAIIAAQGSPLGLGTDIGGSIRVPAHFCGVSSLKPTGGRIRMIGPLFRRLLPGQEAILDSAGVIARRVADLDLALGVIGAAGPDSDRAGVLGVPLGDAGSTSVAGMRIGMYVDDGYFPASPALRRAVREAADALRDRGAIVSEFSPPDVPEAQSLYYGLLTADGGAWARRLLGSGKRDRRVGQLLRLAGLPNVLRPALAAVARLGGQRQLARVLPSAGRQTAGRYWALVKKRADYAASFSAAMDAQRIDAIVCPPSALPALTHGSTYDLGAASVNYTTLYNLLGMPAGVVAATRVRPGEEGDRRPTRDQAERAAVVVESGSAGLPVGVQVVARHWREDVVLGVMGQLETHFRGRPDYPTSPPI